MRPHQGNLMDVLSERSALKHVGKAKTPTMLIHGESDNDVPIAGPSSSTSRSATSACQR